MNKEPVKVKILDMEYDEEEKIFIMRVFNTIKQEEVELAIRASDFGISSIVPIDTINYFCEQMKGKEKNLIIKEDLSRINKNEKLSDEKLLELDEGINKYPLEEIDRKIRREKQRDES